MTIWLLALLLLASSAGMGYRQGAIRVAFSFVGIVLGALLASPLGRLVKPLLGVAGVKEPLILWLLPTLIAFVVVLVAFKVAGHFVHRKVEVYYKYKSGDLRLALWERLHRRLGLALGLLNGAAYLVLVSFVIFAAGYWTVQVASSDGDPRLMRLVDRMGKDLESTGMAKVARAVDGFPASYYEAADIVGMLYHTPLLETRLYSYPAFLGLTERPEFQAVFSDNALTQSWKKQQPILDLLNHPQVKSIVDNPEVLKTVWATAKPDLQDLRTFLETGQSPKYGSEKLLGRWDFDINGATAVILRTKPNISTKELNQTKRWMAVAYAKTSLVAMTDQRALLKDVPHVSTTADGSVTTDLQTIQGQWKGGESNYVFTFNMDGRSEEVKGEIRGDRLSLTSEGMGLAFVKSD